MKRNIPYKCKSCRALWTKGIKDGVHDKWCCKYGKPCYKAESHCKIAGGYEQRGEEDE